MKIIAHARNGFRTKFGVPRQTTADSCLVTHIVFTPEYRIPEALRGIETFSHLWIIWGFDKVERGEASSESSEWSPTVRPPRLGGNVRLGVFATRSPNRPNRIALSSVRLLRVDATDEGKVLVVQGADMCDGTPIYDIKPYIPYTDAHTDATGGFTDTNASRRLTVTWRNNTEIPLTIRSELTEILAADPRPAYHNDPNRIYGLQYSNYEVKFRVQDNNVIVTDILPD